MLVGDKIKFDGERQRYTIQAFNHRYIIATKPFNLRKGKYLYTIVDKERGVRGPDNLIFGALHPYNNQVDAKKNLLALIKGKMEVSHRHEKKLTKGEIKNLTI